MEALLINNEKISYTLENEKNVGDVVRNVESSIVTAGNVIESIAVDDREIPLDYASNDFQRRLADIREMRIITSNQTELAFHTLVTVSEYINTILDDHLKDDLLRSHDSIIEGLKLIYEGTLNSLGMLKIKSIVVLDPEGNSLSDVLAQVSDFIPEYEKRYLDEKGVGKLSCLLRTFLNLIPKIFKWAVVKNQASFESIEKSRMDSYLKTIYSDIHTLCKSSVDKFEETGRLLQIGEDLKALNTLYFIIELLDEIIFIAAITTRNQFNLFDAELFRNLAERLKEIENAFKNGDMITVGDELEYEVKPLIECLTEQLENIKELDKNE
jgi:hypothetical protein